MTPASRRLAGQDRASQDVGLHVHHDDVLAMLEREQGVVDSHRGNSGRIDHDVQLALGDQRLGAFLDVGGAVFECVLKRTSRMLLGAPADPFKRLVRAGRGEIGNAEQVQSGRAGDLGEKHRAKLAGANEADADGFARGGAGLEFRVEVHGE